MILSSYVDGQRVAEGPGGFDTSQVELLLFFFFFWFFILFYYIPI